MGSLTPVFQPFDIFLAIGRKTADVGIRQTLHFILEHGALQHRLNVADNRSTVRIDLFNTGALELVSINDRQALMQRGERILVFIDIGVVHQQSSQLINVPANIKIFVNEVPFIRVAFHRNKPFKQVQPFHLHCEHPYKLFSVVTVQ